MPSPAPNDVLKHANVIAFKATEIVALCAHAGALAHHAQAEAKLAAGVAAGYTSPFHSLPCWPLRTCPYSIVDESVRAGKPKFRLTTDLSWPHAGTMWAGGAAVDSVNGSMDRSAPKNGNHSNIFSYDTPIVFFLMKNVSKS